MFTQLLVRLKMGLIEKSNRRKMTNRDELKIIYVNENFMEVKQIHLCANFFLSQGIKPHPKIFN